MTNPVFRQEASGAPPRPQARPPARRLGPETKISVVIPCFDEEAVLPLLFERLQRVLATWGADSEVILVDDGSRDRTWELLSQFHQADSRWKVVRFGRNFGHQTAIRAGLQASRGDLVAVLDADLQDPPEILKEFFDKWLEGYDVIYGVRQHRKEGVVKRSLYFAFYRLLALLSEIDMPVDAGDFCVMDRRVVDLINRMPERQPFIRGLRSWVGLQQVALPFDRHPRQGGDPKYSVGQLVRLALDGLLSSSTLPLRLATYFGAFMSAVAFGGVVLVLAIRLMPETFASIGIEPIPGVATVAICVLLLGGVQLLCLGILGEYLGRIFENVKGRPLWTIRETLGLDEGRCEPAVVAAGPLRAGAPPPGPAEPRA